MHSAIHSWSRCTLFLVTHACLTIRALMFSSLDISSPSPPLPLCTCLCVCVYLSWYYLVSMLFTDNNICCFPLSFLFLFQRCPKNWAPVHPPPDSNVCIFLKLCTPRSAWLWICSPSAVANAGHLWLVQLVQDKCKFLWIFAGNLGSYGDSHLAVLCTDWYCERYDEEPGKYYL